MNEPVWYYMVSIDYCLFWTKIMMMILEVIVSKDPGPSSVSSPTLQFNSWEN